MSDVIISRRGQSGSQKDILITEYITSDVQWVVPNNVKNNTFHVRIIGGGGSLMYGGGGYSGFMNNDSLVLTPGQTIRVTIGSGAKYFNSKNYWYNGYTTSFGTYLSANGGTEVFGGSAGFASNYVSQNNAKEPQFGGGSRGGNGAGIYGGGGGGSFNYYSGRTYWGSRSTNGGMYGGGGGGAVVLNDTFISILHGGNGGKYGGGGGGAGYKRGNSGKAAFGNPTYTNYIETVNIILNGSNGGNGGEYGGNGGDGIPSFDYVKGGIIGDGNGYWTDMHLPSYVNYPNSTDGTNTSLWTNIFNDGNSYFRGEGKRGTISPSATVEDIWSGPGGGGFGGNGAAGRLSVGNIRNIKYTSIVLGGGGGGGYGGNGAIGDINFSTDWGTNVIMAWGGGGGGYGGDGSSFGGGGGYGKQASGYYGGGGYYCPGGGKNKTYGGGGIGVWSPSGVLLQSYGSGANKNSNAEDGICIIQYYI